MVSINVGVSGNMEDFFFRLKSIPTKMFDEVSHAVGRSIDQVRDYIKNTLLTGQVLNERTGALRRSIQSEQPDPFTGIVYADGSAPYWKAHEFGIKHGWQITPVVKKALAFDWHGTHVVTASVWRKGMPERSFLRKGLQDSIDAIRRNINAAITEGLSK